MNRYIGWIDYRFGPRPTLLVDSVELSVSMVDCEECFFEEIAR